MLIIAKRANAKWTAVRTKSRCEKQVQTYCERHYIAVYLPLRRKARRYQRRVVETFLPMFSGYLFVQINAPERELLLQFPKVVKILPARDRQEEQLIEELQRIQILERTAGAYKIMVRPELAVGKTVYITAGPLEGLAGVVRRRKQKARVAVNVEMLGQSVSIDVDMAEVLVAEN